MSIAAIAAVSIALPPAALALGYICGRLRRAREERKFSELGAFVSGHQPNPPPPTPRKPQTGSG